MPQPTPRRHGHTGRPRAAQTSLNMPCPVRMHPAPWDVPPTRFHAVSRPPVHTPVPQHVSRGPHAPQPQLRPHTCAPTTPGRAPPWSTSSGHISCAPAAVNVSRPCQRTPTQSHLPQPQPRPHARAPTTPDAPRPFSTCRDPLDAFRRVPPLPTWLTRRLRVPDRCTSPGPPGLHFRHMVMHEGVHLLKKWGYME